MCYTIVHKQKKEHPAMQKSNSKILKAESNRSEPKGSGTGIKITLPLNAQKCECWRFFNSRACSGNNTLIYKDSHTESPSQNSSHLFFIPAKLRIISEATSKTYRNIRRIMKSPFECIHALGRAFFMPGYPRGSWPRRKPGALTCPVDSEAQRSLSRGT